MPKSDSERGSGRRREATPLLEWISAAIGLTVTAGIIAYLGWQLATQHDTTPVLSAAVHGIVQHDAGYTVRIVVRNDSAATAAQVHVEGTLTRGEQVRRSLVLLDYVPGRSLRHAGLQFDVAPSAGTLNVRVIGYAEP